MTRLSWSAANRLLPSGAKATWKTVAEWRIHGEPTRPTAPGGSPDWAGAAGADRHIARASAGRRERDMSGLAAGEPPSTVPRRGGACTARGGKLRAGVLTTS